MYTDNFCYKRDIINNKKNNFFCICCFKTLRYHEIKYTKTNKAICSFCKVDYILNQKIEDFETFRKNLFGNDSKFDNSRYIVIKGGKVTVTELIDKHKKILTSY